MALDKVESHVVSGKKIGAGLHAQNLVETSEQSWADTDLALKEPVKYDEGGKDKNQGPKEGR